MNSVAARSVVLAAMLLAVLPGQAMAIQGGEIDNEKTFSNVAILRFIDSDGTYPTDRWRCTGTLVSPTIIITAAHCTEAPADTVYYSFDWQGPLGEPTPRREAPPAWPTIPAAHSAARTRTEPRASSPTRTGTATCSCSRSTTSGSSSSTSQ